MPTVSVGSPPYPESYDKHQVDGINVYVSKGVRTSGSLIIKLKKAWGLNRLIVEGIYG